MGIGTSVVKKKRNQEKRFGRVVPRKREGGSGKQGKENSEFSAHIKNEVVKGRISGSLGKKKNVSTSTKGNISQNRNFSSASREQNRTGFRSSGTLPQPRKKQVNKQGGKGEITFCQGGGSEG